MEDLKDIEGLGQIGAWPLALGWYFVLFIAILLVLCLGLYLYKRHVYRRSWKYQAQLRLEQIQHAKDLNIELKRIAMQAKSRSSCAGLSGEKWLQWLEENDPNAYQWQQHARILLNVQYMPQDNEVQQLEFGNLIQAAKKWVAKC